MSRALTRRNPYPTPSRTPVRSTLKIVSAAARAAAPWLKHAGGRKRSVGGSEKPRKMEVDTKPMFGTTFTARNTYRRRRAPRRVRKRAARSFRTFMRNTLRIQNAQNSLNSNNFTAVADLNSNQWFSFDLCNTNALKALLANQQTSATPGNFALRDMRLALKNFRLTIHIGNTFPGNNGPQPLLMDMYTIIPRRDIDFEEFRNFNGLNGNVMANYFKSGASPVATTNGGELGAPIQSGDTAPSWRSLGFTPFMYPAFCRMFKVINIKSVKLPIGETYVSHFKVGGRTINPTRFLTKEAPPLAPLNDSLSKMYLAGTSMSVLCCIRGNPTGTDIAASTGINLRWEEQSTCKVYNIKASSVGQDIGA